MKYVTVLPALYLARHCFSPVEYCCTCKTQVLNKNKFWELFRIITPRCFKLPILRLETLNLKHSKSSTNFRLALAINKRKAAAENKVWQHQMVHKRQTLWGNECLTGVDHLQKILHKGGSTRNNYSQSSPSVHYGQSQSQSFAGVYFCAIWPVLLGSKNYY